MIRPPELGTSLIQPASHERRESPRATAPTNMGEVGTTIILSRQPNEAKTKEQLEESETLLRDFRKEASRIRREYNEEFDVFRELVKYITDLTHNLPLEQRFKRIRLFLSIVPEVSIENLKKCNLKSVPLAQYYTIELLSDEINEITIVTHKDIIFPFCIEFNASTFGKIMAECCPIDKLPQFFKFIQKDTDDGRITHGFLKQVLTDGSPSFIRAAFRAYWPLWRSLNGFSSPGTLAELLEHINTEKKFSLVYTTIPFDCPYYRQVVEMLQKGKTWNDIDCNDHHYSVKVTQDYVERVVREHLPSPGASLPTLIQLCFPKVLNSNKSLPMELAERGIKAYLATGIVDDLHYSFFKPYFVFVTLDLSAQNFCPNKLLRLTIDLETRFLKIILPLAEATVDNIYNFITALNTYNTHRNITRIVHIIELKLHSSANISVFSTLWRMKEDAQVLLKSALTPENYEAFQLKASEAQS